MDIEKEDKYRKFMEYDSFKLSRLIVSCTTRALILADLDDLPDTPLTARLVQRTEKKILALKKKNRAA